MMGGKMVIEKWRFSNSFKEGEVQTKPDEVAVTTVSLEQVQENQSSETPEMKKKKKLYSVRQATCSLSQICKEVQKSYYGKGSGWLSFLGSMPKIFFSAT